MEIKKYLEAGKIVATHGVKGEVRVQSWCDSKQVLVGLDRMYLDAGERPLRIDDARVHKNIVILQMHDVSTISQAEQLVGNILYVDRAQLPLPEGSYFVQDLLGCQVIDHKAPDIAYGVLQEITQTGANDVYHIKQRDGAVTLIPAIPDVIQEIDLDQRIISIAPLKGLFE